MRPFTICAAIALAAALPGFPAGQGSAQPSVQAPLVANPTLESIPLTLVAGGRRHRYTVELARSADEQRRGMMQRTSMPRDRGMIFPSEPPRRVAFWMEGTILPLDLIFVAPDRTVQRIAADAVPFSRAPIASSGPVVAVLELNGGEAARIGLRPGDAVRYTLPR